MKKIILVAAIALIGLNTYAQEIKKDSTKTNRGHHKKEQLKGENKEKIGLVTKDKSKSDRTKSKLTPEQRNELKTKQLTLALNLSDKQESKIIALNNKTYKNKSEFKKDQKLTEEQMFDARAKRLENKIAYKREMQKILSKDQFTQWEKMNTKNGRKMHHSNKMHAAKKGQTKLDQNKI